MFRCAGTPASTDCVLLSLSSRSSRIVYIFPSSASAPASPVRLFTSAETSRCCVCPARWAALLLYLTLCSYTPYNECSTALRVAGPSLGGWVRPGPARRTEESHSAAARGRLGSIHMCTCEKIVLFDLLLFFFSSFLVCSFGSLLCVCLSIYTHIYIYIRR